MGYSKDAGGAGAPVKMLPGKTLSNLEAAAEVGKVVGGAALAAGAAAAPVVAAGALANLGYERFASQPPGEGEQSVP